jgi:hypothetical protein
MARIFKDSSVLNQFGSPSLNSNTLSNRPAFGQVGRLFVDTTNNVIYRDTGTSWVLVGGAGSTPNLQAVTGVGNTSSNGIFLGASGSLQAGLIFQISGYSLFQQTVSSVNNLGASNVKQFTFVTSGSSVLTGNPSPDFNQFNLNIQVAQTVGGAGNLQIGAGLFENVISGTDNLSFTINQTVGFSALSPIISYQRYIDNGDSNISDMAGMVINGLQRTGAGNLFVTNNYQLLINSSGQFPSTSTVTNKWGIYQAGSNDRNYFAGQSIFNDRVDFNSFIVVNSSVYSGSTITNFIAGNTTNLIFYNNSLNTILGTIFTSGSGNWRIGSGTDNGFKLQVNGTTNTTSIAVNGNLQGGFVLDVTGQSVLRADTYIFGATLYISNNSAPPINITTPTATGVHTATAQHLPIYVNGTLYYLQLLN